MMVDRSVWISTLFMKSTLLSSRRLRLWGTAGPGDVLSHASVSLDVAHTVIVHDSKMPRPECFGHGQRDLCFCLHNPSAHFLNARQHFLFERDSGGAAYFGVGLGN